MAKTVQIEYLFLDLQTCDRCIGTDRVLEEVIKEITPALETAGYRVVYHKLEMSTAELAQQYHFLSSPTIRVNGREVCNSVEENKCDCCSQISGTNVDCRVFEYDGQTYEVPPKAMLAEAVLSSVFAPFSTKECGCYEMPENLKTFYQGKVSNTDTCSCGGCC